VIHLILGQFGYMLSFGFASWGDHLRERYPVTTWPTPQAVAEIVTAIEAQPRLEKTAIVGFSLGSNAAAWIAAATSHPIDLIVAFDPTRQGASLSDYALGKHVRRAICFKGVGYWPSSWFAGGGQLVGPQVEVIPTSTDHLMMQFDNRLRTLAEEALSETLL